MHADLYAHERRALRTDLVRPLDAPELGLAALRDEENREGPIEFMGEMHGTCRIESGMVRIFNAVAEDLGTQYPGASIFVADLFNPYWMMGDLRPLKRAAPWYYGGLPGFEDADLIMIPACPMAPDIQGKILTAMTDAGFGDLHELRRTELYTLFERGGPPDAEAPVALR